MATKNWYLNQVNNALVWEPSLSAVPTGSNPSTTSSWNVSREGGTQYGWMNQTFTGGSSIPDNQLSGSLPSWSTTASTSLTSGTFTRNVTSGASEQLVVDNGVALRYPYNTTFDAGLWRLRLDVSNVRGSPRMDMRMGARIFVGGFETTFNQWIAASGYASPGAVPMFSDASLTTSITEAESQREVNMFDATMDIQWYCDSFSTAGDELGSGNGYLMLGIYFKLDSSTQTRNNEGVQFKYGQSTTSILTSPNIRKKIRATQ